MKTHVKCVLVGNEFFPQACLLHKFFNMSIVLKGILLLEMGARGRHCITIKRKEVQVTRDSCFSGSLQKFCCSRVVRMGGVRLVDN